MLEIGIHDTEKISIRIKPPMDNRARQPSLVLP
jgi:hypothetical protein